VSNKTTTDLLIFGKYIFYHVFETFIFIFAYNK
jgi:hypothetical protein